MHRAFAIDVLAPRGVPAAVHAALPAAPQQPRVNLAVVAANVLQAVQEVAGRRELLELAESGKIFEVPFHRRRQNRPGIPFGEWNGDGSSIQGVTYSIYVPVSLPLQLICSSFLHRN